MDLASPETHEDQQNLISSLIHFGHRNLMGTGITNVNSGNYYFVNSNRKFMTNMWGPGQPTATDSYALRGFV